MQREPGCNRASIEYWLATRGQTVHGAEVALGFGDDLLRKFLRGKTRQLGVDKLQLLADHLRVPLIALLQPVGAVDSRLRILGSTLDPEDDKRTMAEYSSLCAAAEQHWTVHRYLNSYLLHEVHFQAMEQDRVELQARKRLPAAVRSDYLSRAKQFVGLMRKAHGVEHLATTPQQPNTASSKASRPAPSRSPKAFHRIIARQAFFENVSQLDWLGTTYERFRSLAIDPYGRLLLSLLSNPEFDTLDRLVTRILQAAGTPCADEWVAINIIDGRFSLTQVGEMTIACYREDVVSSLIKQLSLAVARADAEQKGYFGEEETDSATIARVNRRTQRLLENELRRIEHRH